MVAPVRQLGHHASDFGEELTPEQQERAKHLIMSARRASAGPRDRRQYPRRPSSAGNIQTGQPVNTDAMPSPGEQTDSAEEDQNQNTSESGEVTGEKTENQSGEPEDVEKKDEGRVASAWQKRLEARRQARADKYKALGIEGETAEVKGVINRYRQIKTIIRAIKAVSAIGTALGDVFFSLGMLFLSINGERVGEWLWVKFRPQYQKQLAEQKKKDPFRMFDDLLFYGGWLLIIIMLLLAAAVIMFLHQKFGDAGGAAALKFIGK